MSRTKKLLEAMMASEAKPLVETTVHADGDKVVIVKNDGSTEEFIPDGQTAEEVVDKFNSIFKHSEGRAWQWLRKIKAAQPVEEGEGDPAPEGDPVNEGEDETTECPFHNILAELINKENITVQEYEEAIIKFNEASELPEEKKARIIEILNHAKNEELEHVNELQLALKILNGEDEAPAPEGEPASAPEEPLPPAEPEAEVEIEMESIKEALSESDEVFALLAKKEFGSFDEVEALFKEKGYEVTDVYREGDGFNLNLRKDGVEYFIPFISVKDKFCATLDNSANLDCPLEEGLGDWIAAKVAKVVGKGNGVNARDDFIAKLQAKLGDACKVIYKDNNLYVLPKEEYIVALGAPVDEKGLHLKDIKVVDVKPAELAQAVKDVIAEVGAEYSDTPAEPEEPKGDEDGFESTGDEEYDDMIRVLLKGGAAQDKIKSLLKKAGFSGEIKFTK